MNVDYACKLADSVMQRFPSASQYPYKDWSYPQGYLLIGFSRLWESAKDIRYRNYIDEYCRSHVTPEGEITGFKGNSRNGMPGQMWVLMLW